MAYDRDSFLAGIAVGRNMQSWPEMQGIGGNFFAFTIRTATASFTYQFGISFAGTVYWGDGSSEEYAYNVFRDRISHVYADAGVYQVLIIGNFQSIQLGSSSGTTPPTPVSSAIRLISIDTPFPQLFRQDGTPIQSVSLNNCFNNCQRLARIPKNLFANYKSANMVITGLYGMFYLCTDLVEIPEKLFDGFEFTSSFTDSTSPVNMFSTCFSLTELPEDIFSNPGFENVTSVRGMFSNCRALTKLPAQLPFKVATDFSMLCTYCYALEELPEGIFDRCESAQSFHQAFNGCSSLQGIPAGLFVSCDLRDLSLSFLSCYELKTIGSGAFANQPNLTNLETAFEASGITEIPQGMFDGCTGILRVDACFTSCLSLETVASDLFSDSPSIDRFSGCFFECSGITSAVPDFWNRYPSATYHSQCFYGCTNATNYADIPSDWR